MEEINLAHWKLLVGAFPETGGEILPYRHEMNQTTYQMALPGCRSCTRNNDGAADDGMSPMRADFFL